MLLKVLKSNSPFVYLLYLIIGVLFWVGSISKPQTYPFFEGEFNSILYNPIFNLTVNTPLLQVILSLLLVLLVAFLIQLVNTSYTLIRVRTKLPAVFFIIIVGGFASLHTLHPVYFAALFTLLGINSLLGIFNNPEPRLDIFNAGLFVAIGSLFYYNLIVLLPAFLIAIAILRREIRGREFFIMVIGFLIPLIFALSFAYITNQLNDIFLNLQKSIFTLENNLINNYPLYIFLGFLIFLTLFGSFKIIQQFDSRKVRTRKSYQVLFLIFLFSILSYIFVPATSQEMLVITAIPLTLLVSNLFVAMKSTFWSELLFSLFFFTAIFMQFADGIFTTTVWFVLIPNKSIFLLVYIAIRISWKSEDRRRKKIS